MKAAEHRETGGAEDLLRGRDRSYSRHVRQPQ